MIINIFKKCCFLLRLIFQLGGPSDLSGGVAPSTTGLLGDIFGLTSTPTMYTPPKTCWLPAEKGKGLEIYGTFSRRAGQMSMDMTLTNKAMQVHKI